MYDPHQLLAQIDDHKWPILALCAVAMACNYIWFIEAFRVARRDRVFTIPIFCTLFWLAHDASFVYRYDTWFDTYDHWYVKLFWIALIFTVAFELAFLSQVIRYGREELLPQASPRQFAALLVAAALVSSVVWEVIKHALGDPLYVTSFGFANVAYPLTAAPLLLRRRSQKGNTPLMWWGFVGLCVCWFTATVSWYGGPFDSWRWIALGGICVAAGLAMIRALGRFPAYAPEPAAASAATTPDRALAAH